MYTATRHGEAVAFLDRAEGWLLEEEDRHNLILSIAYGVATGDFGVDDAFFCTLERDGDLVGCALRTPPHKVLTTDLPVEGGRALAKALAEAYRHIPAVLGPDVAARAVAAGWVEVRGGEWRPGLVQLIHRLDEVRSPEGVNGALREATFDDAELAVAWGEGFARDAGTQFAVSRGSVERWIARGELFVWDDGGPRSISVAHGRTPNGIRIGYVYTPPEWRGRGYASACVADVTARMLEGRAAFCVLYTDASNPTSNAIYQRLGYRPIAEVRDVDLCAEGVAWT
jgi:predicted GNAT family acetyltransferase